MARLARVLIALGLLLAASALAVGPFGDRELFVPPPDAVGEQFVREVVEGRYSRAQEYLREKTSEEDLRELRARLPENPTEIEADTVVRDRVLALVNVRASNAARSGSIGLSLGFDKEWKIAR